MVRTQIMLRADQRETLKRYSQNSGAPLNELVRRAIDFSFPAAEVPAPPKKGAKKG